MRLSVVIATKDRASYIERALASLALQQGAPSFEAIVVDNGSTDTTRSVVQAAAERSNFPIRYLFEAEPNRGKARNRGVAVAEGFIVLFCDDDVVLPPGFLAAHEAAHDAPGLVVNGAIVNVPDYEHRPKPSLANYSGAFLCTCNVSIPKAAIDAVGGFDESFDLYGWEDTELGVRLRESGMRRRFSWDAFLWHIKKPSEETLDVLARKAVEKARMARRFIDKSPSSRVKAATGAHRLNLLRAKYLLPDSLLAFYAGVASDERANATVRAIAKTQFLDGIYARELSRALEK
ncbi:MAG: glycosyltransferase family 2 protein [Candidatus Eremiobacteraeota bacterium]|nr:glycosyltransferase family 2 protein [Candidatus Eremiobacteraeota bacterium]